MVFLKRSSIWNEHNCSTSKTQLLSKPIESLIDEVRENGIRVIIYMKVLLLERSHSSRISRFEFKTKSPS